MLIYCFFLGYTENVKIKAINTPSNSEKTMSVFLNSEKFSRMIFEIFSNLLF